MIVCRKQDDRSIAWAFFKGFACDGGETAIISRELRLQLYEFPSMLLMKSGRNSLPLVFYCWKRRHYPCLASISVVLDVIPLLNQQPPSATSIQYSEMLDPLNFLKTERHQLLAATPGHSDIKVEESAVCATKASSYSNAGRCVGAVRMDKNFSCRADHRWK